jgi:predicted Zn-dependent protease
MRRLLRIHELGHALGYNHVKSRRSIMNPTLGSEPTDFDRRAAMVAFRR